MTRLILISCHLAYYLGCWPWLVCWANR